MRIVLPSGFRRVINALPNINEHPASGQAAFGVVVSLLVHLAILIVWLGSESGWLGNLLVPAVSPPAEMDIVIQTATPPPSFEQKLTMPLEKLAQQRERVDSTGLQEAKEAPQGASFFSDKNLAAGSRERPTGTAPLPTVTGKQYGSKYVLADQDMRAGTRPGESSPGGAGASRSLAKKGAVKREAAAMIPSMDELAELTGELVFRKVSAESVSASRSRPEISKPSAIEPLKSGKPVSEELSEEGKVAAQTQGGLAENGKVGVNALKSPMGIFMKSVSRAIGLPWNQLVNSRMESIEPGVVEVRIWVFADGRVARVDVERSSAKPEFVELCLEAVREAQLEAPPPEAQSLMREGLLPIPFKFNFL